MINTRTFLLLIVLGLISLIGWHLSGRFYPPATERIRDLNQLPDYSMSDFTITAMNTNGENAYFLKATHMEHFPETDLIIVEKPDFEMTRSSGLHWSSAAKQGFLTESNKTVILKGDVVIQRNIAGEQTPLVINTDSLRIKSDSGSLDTRDPIRLQDNGNRIQATGMQANVKNRNILLMSDVRGTYEPQP